MNAGPDKTRGIFPFGYLALAPVFSVFWAMAAWSWRKWPDVMVDFGEQLYAPWQICRGKVLYRDIGYIIGPLSQYFNALLFKVFGVSLSTLIASNLSILALLILFIYHLFLRVSDQVVSAAICIVILTVFSFSQYVGIANYNYICPYSHEAFHGLVLAIFQVGLLAAWANTRKPAWAGAAGFCCGLVFLTKPEIFVAAAACTGAALCLSAPRARWKGAACFCALATLPVLGFFLYFQTVIPGWGALHAVLGSWSAIASTPAVRNDFYKWCLGLDEPIRNTLLMVAHFAGASLALLVCAFCARRGEGINASRRLLSWALIGSLAWAAYYFDWAECGRSLPLLLVLICAVLAWTWRRGDQRERRDLILPLLWSVFALVLLAKMGVHCRVWHYGFCLAMPAAVSVLYFAGWFLPRSLRGRGVDEAVFRTALFLLVAVGVVRLLGISNGFYRVKNYAVGHGGDRMMYFNPRVEGRGLALNLALDWLNRNTPADATLCVVPEGIMLNYLSRRPNPTRYTTLVMMATQKYPESELLAAFSNSRPDYIAIIHKDTSEWGVRFFGQEPNFGLLTMRWINQNYRAVWLLGHEPLQNDYFGIKIMKRGSGNGVTAHRG